MQVVDTSSPVVVLRLVRGLFPHGSLGVVRTLGRLGIPALGFHDDRWAPAALSRYDRGKLLVLLDPSAQVKSLQYLSRLGRELGCRSMLIPTEDVSALFVDEHAQRRGALLEEAGQLSARALLGDLVAQVEVQEGRQVLVALDQDRQAAAQPGRRLGQLGRVRRLDGLLQGDYRTLFRGFGLDLADLREYQYHDDVRYIDWNVTARLSTPYVREYHEDREVTAWFLLDLSPSVDFGAE